MIPRPLSSLVLAFFLCASLVVAQPGPGRQFGPFTLQSEAKALEVISQGQTGTCWSFATISFLESEVLRTTGQAIDLSEMYLVRHAIVEKAKRYVMLGGRAQFSEGGLSHDIIAMARHHGIVPASAYSGLVPGEKAHDHSELFSLLETLVKTLGDPESKKKPSARWLQGVAGFVDGYLGAPPMVVEHAGKTLSPKAYAKDVLKLDLEGYVELMSFSYTPFHEAGELLVPDNWMRFQGYRNLPIDELMVALDHALHRGHTAAVDMDVSEPGFKAGQGIATLPESEERPGAITQQVRDEMFRTGKTTDDHLMHVIGIARHEDGRKFYFTKNSWGETGPYKGYLFISENFMRAKILAFMVHRSGLPTAGETGTR